MTIDEMKQRKRDLGYTNEKIAELSGVPVGTVQKIFSGETRSPRYETIRRLEPVLSEQAYTGYKYVPDNIIMAAESSAVYGSDSYNYYKQWEKKYKKIHNSDYSPVPVSSRIGIAAGKFKVPDESFFYDDEIADMFEDI